MITSTVWIFIFSIFFSVLSFSVKADVFVYPFARNMIPVYLSKKAYGADSFIIDALKGTKEIDIVSLKDFSLSVYEISISQSQIISKKPIDFEKEFDEKEFFVKIRLKKPLSKSTKILIKPHEEVKLAVAARAHALTLESQNSLFSSGFSWASDFGKIFEAKGSQLLYRLVLLDEEKDGLIYSAEAYPFALKRGQNLVLEILKDPSVAVKIDLDNDGRFDLETTESIISIDPHQLDLWPEKEVKEIKVCSRKNCIVSSYFYTNTRLEYRTKVLENLAIEWPTTLNEEEILSYAKVYDQFQKYTYDHLREFEILLDWLRPKLLASFSDNSYDFAYDRVVTASLGYDPNDLKPYEVRHINFENLNIIELSISFWPKSFNFEIWLHVINHEYFYSRVSWNYFFSLDPGLSPFDTIPYFVHEGYLTAFQNPNSALEAEKALLLSRIEDNKNIGLMPMKEFSQNVNQYFLDRDTFSYVSFVAHWLYWFFEPQFETYQAVFAQYEKPLNELFSDVFSIRPEDFLYLVNQSLLNPIELKKPQIEITRVVETENGTELEISVSGQTDYLLLFYTNESLSPIKKVRAYSNDVVKIAYTGYDSLLVVAKSISSKDDIVPRTSYENYYKVFTVLDTDSSFFIYRDYWSSDAAPIEVLYEERDPIFGTKYDIYQMKFYSDENCLDLRPLKDFVVSLNYESAYEREPYLVCKDLSSEAVVSFSLKDGQFQVLKLNRIDAKILPVRLHHSDLESSQ